MTNPPTDETRSFALQYQLSRQLGGEDAGELWQGEKNGQAIWGYYLPLVSPADEKHWQHWLGQLKTLNLDAPTLSLPLSHELENGKVTLAYPMPAEKSLRESSAKLDEWQLAVLLLNISAILEKIPLSSLPYYLQTDDLFPRKEGGYQWARFGLRTLQAGLSSFQGTIKEAYLAPEIVAGTAPTSASSVFSLGVCLYELAGGGLAFGNEGGRRAARVQTNLPTLPQLSARFNQVLQLMLASKPDRRPNAETLHRLAKTFMREKHWKSVGGFAFARDVSGIPLSKEKKAFSDPKTSPAKSNPRPKAAPPKPIKPAQNKKEKARPIKKTEIAGRSPKEAIKQKNRLRPLLILVPVLGLLLLGGYLYVADEASDEALQVAAPVQGLETIEELMRLREEFRAIIQEMVQNPNLPPTEKTFLRLAQMQQSNLEESLQERFRMEGDQVIAWKGKADMSWLRQTQTQLKRNLQNLELLQ